MTSIEVRKKDQQQLNIQFEFINFKKTLKISVSPRSSIKALRPIFANKFSSDFAHMRIRVTTKGPNKNLIDIEVPFYQNPYFSDFIQQQYALEV